VKKGKNLMEIIVSHRNADFDALGSMVAASRLYPGAVRVASGGLPPIVRKFLSLHMDHFELTPVKEVDLATVTRMIVVDVRRKSRLKDFGPLLERIETGAPPLEVHVYDHHQAAPDDLQGREVHVEPVGAACTLLVERLKEGGIPVTPIEATAMALGIYADTGSLTYESTTVRDAQAAAFLLSRGASRTTLRYFLHAPLNTRQWQLLTALLSGSSTLELGGVKIGISTVSVDKMLPGLSELVGEALTYEGNDAIFGLFPRGTNVTIIGRSRLQSVDVGAVLQHLGGGGHHGAGSATLKNTTPEKARAALIGALEASPPQAQLIRQRMSTPVYTVSPDQPLDDVRRQLERKKISGAPVLKDGQLVGIISKRDIRAASLAGRMHLSVSSCMSHEVKTIGPDQSLVRAVEKMAEEQLGRLPVVRGDNLLGIITRNDILNVIYQGS
jgi:tRNA nucleotidyltransferase (CCA-adding enzyme)